MTIGHGKAAESIEEAKGAFEVMQKYMVEAAYKQRIDLTGGEERKYSQ